MSGALTDTSILAGASQLSGYEIDQSCRFNVGDSPYLTRTYTGADTQKATWSFWFKRTTLSANQMIWWFGSNTSGGDRCYCYLKSTDKINFFFRAKGGTGTAGQLETNRLIRDSSAWYHFVVAVDTTQAVAADRIQMYLNGVNLRTTGEIGTNEDPTQNNYLGLDTSPAGMYINERGDNAYDEFFGGYLAEFYFIQGTQYAASDFGETNEDTNQWIPKDASTLTFGTNGFFLKFEDSAALGNDSSGNTNNLTVTNLVATDKVLDSPTNNFATFNPLVADTPSGAQASYKALSEGSLKAVGSYAGDTGLAPGTFSFGTGKWYVEFVATSLSGAYPHIGIIETTSCTTQGGYAANSVMYKADGGKVENSTNTGGVGDSWVAGDVMGMAIDCTNGAVYFAKNNTWQNSGVPTSGATKTGAFMTWTGEAVDFVTTTSPYTTSAGVVMNCGQDSSFAGEKTAQGNSDSGTATTDFYYTPPTNFLALCTDNLADPSIAFPAEHFNTVLWTGDAANPRTITGVGFESDLTWIKSRSQAYSHQWYDQVRGEGKVIYSNTNGAEADSDASGHVSAWTSDGFTLYGSNHNNDLNGTGYTFVGWNWIGGGTAVSNTDGSITSSVSANTTAGFSIVGWTGTETTGATVGHGLSQAPDLIIMKHRTGSGSASGGWRVGSSISYLDWTQGYFIVLNEAGGRDAATNIWDTVPTASVFEVNSNASSNGTGGMVAYCIHSLEGYSKVGTYIGNVNANGTFAYLGFRPAMIMIKGLAYSSDWHIFDNKRIGYNVANYDLTPSENVVEITDARIDFLSNGFKIRTNAANINSGDAELLYYAVAEIPFKYGNGR